MYNEEIKYISSIINNVKNKTQHTQYLVYEAMNELLNKYKLTNLEAAPVLDSLEQSIGLVVSTDSNFNKLESETKLYAMRLQTKLSSLLS